MYSDEFYREMEKLGIIAPRTSFASLLDILMENFLPNDKEVFLSRKKEVFGFGEDLTYKEIGEKLGVGKERVRQIHLRAIRKFERNISRLISKQASPRIIIKGSEDYQLFVRMPVYDLAEFSVRTSNSLKNDGITTIEDLLRKTERELLITPNFGKKSLLEIKNALAKYGLELDEQ